MSKPTATKFRRPNLRHQKSRGAAFIEVQTKRVYLGRFGSPAAAAAYKTACRELKEYGHLVTIGKTETTVADVVVGFLEYAREEYPAPANRQQSTEVSAFEAAAKPLLKLFAGTPAKEFGPLDLAAVRQKMVEKGWCRNYVNIQTGRIRAMFRYAVSQEWIGSDKMEGLRSMKPLKYGKTAARESEKVHPVDPSFVRSIYPHVVPQVTALLEVMLQTGARCGEVIQIRPCDLKTDEEIWWFTPAKHKTQHHGKDRVIAINQQAIETIRPFLDRPTDTYIFSPAEADLWSREQKRARRKTPLYGKKKLAPDLLEIGQGDRKFNDRYGTSEVGRAVTRACRLAYPLPSELAHPKTDDQKAAVKAWRKQHHFHVHQIRHTVLTKIADQSGAERAQATAGHSSITTTMRYVKPDRQSAAAAVSKLWSA